MTVRELKAQLENLNDDMTVMSIDAKGDCVRVTEFTFVTKYDLIHLDDEVFNDERFPHGYCVIS